MSLKRARSLSPAADNEITPPDARIYHSTRIEDRLSIFIAHYSPSVPAKSLQSQAQFKSASHRIAAWRKPSSQRALSVKSSLLYDTGSDDDGERYAGKRLEKVLADMNVTGAVVVARWYGGVLLGPVRFNHIETCAREAIRQWLEDSKKSVDEASKKRRIEAEDEDRKRSATELAERDNSITILRGLLAEKRQGTAGSNGSATNASSQSPSKSIDYAKMSLDALRRLDKSRDATIAFLLREIDKAELECKSPDSNEVSSASKPDTEPS
jgi:putative IMPACT (imprinted ancient) family translation regulator